MYVKKKKNLMYVKKKKLLCILEKLILWILLLMYMKNYCLCMLKIEFIIFLTYIGL